MKGMLMRYAILKTLHANARYEKSILPLMMGELRAALKKLGYEAQIEQVVYNGLELMTFEVPAKLNEEEAACICSLSSLRALFEYEQTLIPAMQKEAHGFADMPYILKYKGKTNEAFTRFLINMARFHASGRVGCVLDPLCGKGTTLFMALSLGLDACGVENDKKEVGECVRFVKSYLQRERIKHAYKAQSMTHKGRQAGMKHSFSIQNERSLQITLGDTQHTQSFYKTPFDILTADLPYGIQHGAKGGALRLVQENAAGWKQMLKKGGALAIAFNAHTASRDDLAKALALSGLDVLRGDGYEGMQHFVEQAVLRDVLIATAR
jgi:16S rRNA G966 N2-methylase RsmD